MLGYILRRLGVTSCCSGPALGDHLRDLPEGAREPGRASSSTCSTRRRSRSRRRTIASAPTGRRSCSTASTCSGLLHGDFGISWATISFLRRSSRRASPVGQMVWRARSSRARSSSAASCCSCSSPSRSGPSPPRARARSSTGCRSASRSLRSRRTRSSSGSCCSSSSATAGSCCPRPATAPSRSRRRPRSSRCAASRRPARRSRAAASGSGRGTWSCRGSRFALFFVALYMRIVRARMLEVLEEPYIRTARAKGASEFRVIRVARAAQRDRARRDDGGDGRRDGDRDRDVHRDGLRPAGLGRTMIRALAGFAGLRPAGDPRRHARRGGGDHRAQPGRRPRPARDRPDRRPQARRAACRGSSAARREDPRRLADVPGAGRPRPRLVRRAAGARAPRARARGRRSRCSIAAPAASARFLELRRRVRGGARRPTSSGRTSSCRPACSRRRSTRRSSSRRTGATSATSARPGRRAPDPEGRRARVDGDRRLGLPAPRARGAAARGARQDGGVDSGVDLERFTGGRRRPRELEQPGVRRTSARSPSARTSCGSPTRSRGSAVAR